MIFLGIDPALNQTGYALVLKKSNNSLTFIESGTIKNKVQEEFPQKLLKIFTTIDKICHKHTILGSGIEETFVNVNSSSSLKLGAARGSIITCLAKNGIPIKEFAPNTVKKTITGAGKAMKIQVEFMVQRLISNVPSNLSSDEYDALAIAFCTAL